MTKADLVEQVADTVGPRVTERDCALVVDAFLDAVKDTPTEPIDCTLFVVPVLKRLRVTPSMPSSLISRATRLRLTRSPSARSTAWILGQP